MLGLPPPYPEELLYSTIARAGVHDGDVSPKQLLDMVFGNRKVIATVDLPSHVEDLAKQYSNKLSLDANTLIQNHTLWPIYTNFQSKERSHNLKHKMLRKSYGGVHLESGIAASRVKAKTRLYACPGCLKEQRDEFGECFLKRIWQVPLIRYCSKHGPLCSTDIEINGEHRHTYYPINPSNLLDAVKIAEVDLIFTQQVEKLMACNPVTTSFEQWTAFYRRLAGRSGFMNGSKVNHKAIQDLVIQFWGKDWLELSNFLPIQKDTSWLRGIFRKHRKSFSFAEHIVVVTAMSQGEVCISSAVLEASTIQISEKNAFSGVPKFSLALGELSGDQLRWQNLLKEYSPKQARDQDRALYARLYRNYHDWLIQIDHAFHTYKVAPNYRVDWSARDRHIARELWKVCIKLAENLNTPHLSKTYLICQLANRAMIEKNLYRLPRCKKLLSLYSESVDEYQLRRITRAFISMREQCLPLKRWVLLRSAGLSNERMTNIVSRVLKDILNEQT